MSNFYMVLSEISWVFPFPPVAYAIYIAERGDWTDGNANNN